MKELSIRNQLEGKIKAIVLGPVVSEVVVKTKAGTVASIITSHSVKDMKLKKGDRVFVMIKATEASIQKFRGQRH
jgi:molybdate transport system regulatory protein